MMADHERSLLLRRSKSDSNKIFPAKSDSNRIFSPRRRGLKPRTRLSEIFAEPPAPAANDDTVNSKTTGFLSLTLENTGSVARDHLSVERTFLSYIRTSLAVASSGVALIQLFTLQAPQAPRRLHAVARPLGAVTVVLGLGILLIGLVRYFTVQSALLKGKFPVTRFLAGAITVALSLLVTTTFAILVGGNFKDLRD